MPVNMLITKIIFQQKIFVHLYKSPMIRVLHDSLFKYRLIVSSTCMIMHIF